MGKRYMVRGDGFLGRHIFKEFTSLERAVRAARLCLSQEHPLNVYAVRYDGSTAVYRSQEEMDADTQREKAAYLIVLKEKEKAA